MNAPKKLTTGDFINSPKVIQNLQRLEAAFGAGGSRLVISDVLDKDGHQYVNLVQKGGGVLGVALLGYTYALEQMGIRFLRLAGTSAGAINTAMLAIIGKKEDPKSVKVLEAVAGLDFFDLVDGRPIAKWLTRKFITKRGFLNKLKAWWLGIGIFYTVLLVTTFVCLWLLPHNSPMLHFTQTLVIVLLVATLLLGGVVYYITRLLKRLKCSGYGINPGNFFYDWMKDQMQQHGVNTMEDLVNKATQPVPGMHLRTTNKQGTDQLSADVTFIASELITENKIEFPKMCNLFRPPSRINELHPAGLVRASMSIPFFFESYFIYGIPREDAAIKAAWLETFGLEFPPGEARFVDGGILSNFPVSIFYNPAIEVPRLPVFGIDLDDSDPADNSGDMGAWTFMGYLSRIFNTVRNYYDKDFQLKNKVYSKGIGTILLPEFNWLNFFITEEEKLALFEKGVAAAADFLLGFDWQSYKRDRSFMQSTLEQHSNRKGD
ncbi:Patatin [Niabella ginsenosidivorans]|uniref:Patatin n=1 Tax=Niabella ginsenosidivorans TaxID=1176587 RepID=A0A1A9HW15_9BACT|nr:patatin-like phospholipase family protein [Niabella ginsenosidivorans]ANH79577.1 Patatin [Niabella ginsenosidivorans]